jgi:4-diphosphocytidyl-2-C-methyl-D-erythritol kinase
MGRNSGSIQVMRVKSFAKINLGIEVLGKRKDEYHNIRTLFQSIDFYDVLEFYVISDNKIDLSVTDDTISWGTDNLIFQAALSLKQKLGLSNGIKIKANKKIPPGKGLGGGSSNAAMTLLALNKIWELHCTPEELTELAKGLGADVPYFLTGGLCLGTGKGDEIKPLEDLPVLYCVLALPDVSIPTSSIYANLPETLTSEEKDSKITKFFHNRNYCGLINSLEEAVFSLYPQIEIIKGLFQANEAELSLLSGSGSAVFGLFKTRKNAQRVFKELNSRYSVIVTKTLPRQEYKNRIYVGV